MWLERKTNHKFANVIFFVQVRSHESKFGEKRVGNGDSHEPLRVKFCFPRKTHSHIYIGPGVRNVLSVRVVSLPNGDTSGEISLYSYS